jgi:uncharacterized RDD family membrane protein YckC
MPLWSRDGSYDGRFRLAPWWRRGLAALLDEVAVAVVTVGLRAMLARYVIASTLAHVDRTYILQLATAVIGATLYYPIQMQMSDGLTFGKRLLHIRVVTVTLRQMTLGLAMKREVVLQTIVIGGLASLHGWARLVGVMVAVPNYLWPLHDSEKRAGHDLICGTRVVMDDDVKLRPVAAED